MFIVLIGPDGSGKTRLAKSLFSNFSNAIYFHYLPFKKNINNFESKTVEKKDKSKNKLKVFFSIPKLVLKLIFVNTICKFKFYKWNKEKKLIIGDRFLYNYYLDPQSIEYYSSEKVAKYFIEKVLLKPDIIFYLKTTSNIILSRKNELTKEQIEYYNNNALNLDFKNLTFVDADNEFEIVLDEITTKINEKYL